MHEWIQSGASLVSVVAAVLALVISWRAIRVMREAQAEESRLRRLRHLDDVAVRLAEAGTAAGRVVSGQPAYVFSEAQLKLLPAVDVALEVAGIALPATERFAAVLRAAEAEPLLPAAMQEVRLALREVRREAP